MTKEERIIHRNKIDGIVFVKCRDDLAGKIFQNDWQRAVQRATMDVDGTFHVPSWPSRFPGKIASFHLETSLFIYKSRPLAVHH
jgi:hypothetical protein